MKHASEGSSTLALKPRTDITTSPKQGYQWPHVMVSSKNFLMFFIQCSVLLMVQQVSSVKSKMNEESCGLLFCTHFISLDPNTYYISMTPGTNYIAKGNVNRELWSTQSELHNLTIQVQNAESTSIDMLYNFPSIFPLLLIMERSAIYQNDWFKGRFQICPWFDHITKHI